MSSDMVRLGSNGRLVIPVELRRELGIGEGDELLLRVKDGELRISTPAVAIRQAQEIVRRYVPEGHSLSNELIAERRAESEREA